MTDKTIKAYFETSIAGKDKYLPLYKKIVSELESLGCQVRQSIFEVSFEEKEKMSKEEAANVYKRILREIAQSDVFICDMTYPSPGVAMEVQDAIYRFKKPALVLYHESKEGGKPGAPFYGNPSKLLFLDYYNEDNLKHILKSFLRRAKRKIPSERFTVRMNEELDEYVEFLKILWKESSKNDVVTRLILKEMESDETYRKLLTERLKNI